MGCDIHIFAEMKHKDNPDWTSINSEDWFIHRNYLLFQLLANDLERYDGIPDKLTFDARGIPKDAAWAAKMHYYSEIDPGVSYETLKAPANPDWHTPSWLSLQEFEEAVFNYKAYYKFVHGWTGGIPEIPDADALLAAMKVYANTGIETRIVFWFDN